MGKQEVKYQKTYDDNSKERLTIRYENKDYHQIIINDQNVIAEIDFKDLEWLIDVLNDINYIHKQNIKDK